VPGANRPCHPFLFETSRGEIFFPRTDLNREVKGFPQRWFRAKKIRNSAGNSDLKYERAKSEGGRRTVFHLVGDFGGDPFHPARGTENTPKNNLLLNLI
jgi:hypothetical protein